jgi:hypothetical protein
MNRGTGHYPRTALIALALAVGPSVATPNLNGAATETSANWLAFKLDLTHGNVSVILDFYAPCEGERICVGAIAWTSANGYRIVVTPTTTYVSLFAEASTPLYKTQVWTPYHDIIPQFPAADPIPIGGHEEYQFSREDFGDWFGALYMFSSRHASINVQVDPPTAILALQMGNGTHVMYSYDFDSVVHAAASPAVGAEAGVLYSKTVMPQDGMMGVFIPSISLDAGVVSPEGPMLCQSYLVKVGPTGVGCVGDFILRGSTGAWTFWMSAQAEVVLGTPSPVLLWVDTPRAF